MGGRRVTAVLAFVALIVGTALLMAAPGQAQESPPPTVLPTIVETTVTPTTETPSPSPSPSPSPTVGGNVITPGGSTGSLPRTGGDLDAEVLVGVGLLAMGLALAITARRRRHQMQAV
jgi:LPXTG-motif cell wall-anchored protein